MKKSIYNKLKDFLRSEGFEISSEQGIPDTAMYCTQWDIKNSVRVQFNVNFIMRPPQKLLKNKKL